MNQGHNGSDGDQGGLVRGIVAIVALGVALGVTFNGMQLASGPRRGLAWIKHEVKLASLESVAGTAVAAPIDSSGGNASNPGAPSAVKPNADSTRADSARADSARAKPSKPGKTTKASKPGATAKASKPGATTKPAAGAAASTKPGAAASTGATPTPTSGTPSTATATPRVTDVPVVPDTREPLEAQYANIKKLWDAGAAIFVDARSPQEYAEGHIPGSVNLPFDDVFKDPEKAKHLDTRGRAVVITYCGGGDCDLSRNLAFSLIDAGQKKVLVFMGGLPGWKDGGNPVATGAAPGTAP